MKYKEILKNEEINAYLKKGDANLGLLGFTDHSQAHCVQVAHQAGKILERFEYPEHEIELAKIAGYMLSEMRSTEHIMRNMEHCWRMIF